MTSLSLRRALPWLLAIPVLIGIGFNVYMVRTIRSELRLTPSGYVSDLYPSWRATHDLLLHGTNPYLASQTVQYERGYYGGIPDDPGFGGGVGYQGFVYPLFFCILLSPLALIPFGAVQWLAIAGMLVIIALSSRSWMDLTGWPGSARGRWIAGLVWAGSAPSVYLASLQQPTGFVAGMLGLAAVLVARRRFGWAGAVMAAGMFKPQLTLIPLIGVLVWAWRQHRLAPFLRGFVIAASTLGLASLALQPDWPRWFISQLHTYASVNDFWNDLSIFPVGLPRTAAMAGVILASFAVAVLPWLFDTEPETLFTDAFALLIAATLMVNSSVLVYNAVLVIFPLVVALRRCAWHRLRVVRFPTALALILTVASFGSGVVGAVFALSGHRSVAVTMMHVMVFGFVLIAPLLWIALVTFQAAALSRRVPARLVQRLAARS